MKSFIIILLTLFLASCSSSRVLKQCQVDGVESLSKGMNQVGTKLPTAYARINKYLTDNTLMANLTQDIFIDSVYESATKKIEALTTKIAKLEADNQRLQNEIQTGWSLCIKISELLKAIANPDFYKVFDSNKDKLSTGFDSLINKYNYLFTNQLKPEHGKLFSEIAIQIGKGKIKRRQAKIFKMAIDSTASDLTTIIASLKSIQLKNFEKDLATIDLNYMDTYIEYNRVLLKKIMTPENAVKISGEMEKAKKELIYLADLGKNLTEFCDQLQKMIAALKDSVSGSNNCETINHIITDLDLISNKTDIYSAFLK